jgi:hypothetical protein
MIGGLKAAQAASGQHDRWPQGSIGDLRAA